MRRIRLFPGAVCTPRAALSALAIGVAVTLPAMAQTGPAAPLPSGLSPIAAEVAARINQGGCDAGSTMLNRRLRTGDADVYAVAGMMFEGGLCVTQSWQRAEAFYIQAAERGSRVGLDRLVAAYADPRVGNDIAAALWWARSDAGHAGDGSCQLAPAGATPQQFVETLRGLPVAQLRGCVYASGVLAMTRALADADAAARALPAGQVVLGFHPASGRFDGVQRSDGQELARAEWSLSDVPAMPAPGLLQVVRSASVQAGLRYRLPEGVDPALRASMQWTHDPR
jgi:hypothetical protein